MENNTNTVEETTATQPEVNGGKTFTQDEVNRIVSERLARERSKAEPTPEEQRALDLKAREEKITCNEFLTGKGYPENVVKGMLEIFDTSDSEKFKQNVEKLLATFPAIVEPFCNPVASTSPLTMTDKLASIFKPKT